MGNAAGRENPYSAPAGLRGRVRRRPRWVRDAAIVGAAFVLVLIVAPLVMAAMIWLIVPPILPGASLVVYSWLLTLLRIASSVVPCVIAGSLLGYKRISSSTRTAAVWGLFAIMLLYSYARATILAPERWAGWSEAIGTPTFLLQRTIGIVVPIGFVVCGILVARSDRAGRIKRKRRKDASVRRKSRSS